MKKLTILSALLSSLIVKSKALEVPKTRITALPNTVALTFDDGPSPVFTPQILKILKEENVKATFFVMGWAARDFPYLIKQMIKDGHSVGSHTNSHKNLTKLTREQLNYEISMPKEEITKVLGTPPLCLRPPFAATNNYVKQVVRSYGLKNIGIGMNSFDYDQKKSKEWLIKWVVKHSKSGRMFTLHDGFLKRQKTVDALRAIIKGIKKKGLGFSTVCDPFQKKNKEEKKNKKVRKFLWGKQKP